MGFNWQSCRQTAQHTRRECKESQDQKGGVEVDGGDEQMIRCQVNLFEDIAHVRCSNLTKSMVFPATSATDQTS